MTDLVEQARVWVRETSHSPHVEHLERTLDWTLELDPGASEALQIAAVTHDMERAFPDGAPPFDSAQSWDDPVYNRLHQDRSADIVAAWLRDHGAEPALVREVDALVRVHEEGGFPDADVLQAADSLSFLEVMTDLIRGWITSGRAPRERALGKVHHSYERMRVERARELGAPLYEQALARCEDAEAPADARA